MALAVAACDGAAPARGWVKLEPVRSAGPKDGHGMAYDSGSARAVLFGGRIEGGETWAFDACSRQWTEMFPAETPPVVKAPAMAYDSGGDRIVLLAGGPEAGLAASETWAYDVDADVWTELHPAGASPERGVAMAYDAGSDRLVLWGGREGVDETWTFDREANAWQLMHPAQQPTGARALAYDSALDLVIAFGAAVAGGAVQETWAYDFETDTWTNRNALNAPAPAAARDPIAFDARTGRTVTLRADGSTWRYHAAKNVWIEEHPSPSPPASAHALVEAPELGGVLMYGGDAGRGFDETWLYLAPEGDLPGSSGRCATGAGGGGAGGSGGSGGAGGAASASSSSASATGGGGGAGGGGGGQGGAGGA